MFCDQCGTSLRPESKFCPGCGNPVYLQNQPAQLKQTTTNIHQTQYPDNSYNSDYQNNFHGQSSPGKESELFFGDKNYDAAWENYLNSHPDTETMENKFVTKVLPLFSSPLYIITAILIAITSILLIINCVYGMSPETNITSIPSIIATFCITLSSILLFVGVILIIPAAATKNKFLSGCSFIVLSIYSFFASLIILLYLLLLIVVLISSLVALSRTTFGYASYNIIIILSLIFIPILSVFEAAYIKLGIVCIKSNKALNDNTVKLKPGVLLPITTILMSVLMVFLLALSISSLYTFFFIFLDLSVLVLLTVFFFILRAKAE